MQFSVLMYHDITENKSVLSVSPDRFAEHMVWLKEHDFQGMLMSEAAGRLSGGKNLPEKTVVITFDDGLESVYQKAFPVLQKLSLPATVFTVTGSVGLTNSWPGQPGEIPGFPMMTWEQIRELDRWGVEIGSHTVTHPRLDKIKRMEQSREILSSKSTLEKELDHPIHSFAYPYGDWNETSLSLVHENYANACTTYLAMASSQSNPYLIPRIDAYYLISMPIFRLLSTPGLTGFLAIRRILRKFRSMLRN